MIVELTNKLIDNGFFFNAALFDNMFTQAN